MNGDPRVDTAIYHAAGVAWEHDHPRDSWLTVPASVREAMCALVAPTVRATIAHLDDMDSEQLVELMRLAAVEPDTFPDGAAFDVVIRYALRLAETEGTGCRLVLKGTPLIAVPGDTWQDVATRYHEATTDPARQ